MRENKELLKTLSDDTRLKILMLLSQQEMAVCELNDMLHLSQPAVSHHLRLLKQSGLIQDNRQGKWIFYTINQDNLREQLRGLQDFLQKVQQNLALGVRPSPIRDEPCLCEKLKSRARKG